MEASGRLLEFRRTGGRAANDDSLVVDHAGHARLRTPTGTWQFELGPGTVEQLRHELEGAGFAELAEDLPPPEADHPNRMWSSTPSPLPAAPSMPLAVRSRHSWCRWWRR